MTAKQLTTTLARAMATIQRELRDDLEILSVAMPDDDRLEVELHEADVRLEFAGCEVVAHRGVGDSPHSMSLTINGSVQVWCEMTSPWNVQDNTWRFRLPTAEQDSFYLPPKGDTP